MTESRGGRRSRGPVNPNSIESKLQYALSHSDDPELILQRSRFTTPILYPEINNLPAKQKISEQDEQLIQISRILNDTYTSSGYYIINTSTEIHDVDRYSDRYRILEQNKRYLFDENSLSMRGFPPELLDMAQNNIKRRRKLAKLQESQQRFMKSFQQKSMNGVDRDLENKTDKNLDEEDEDDDDKELVDVDTLEGLEDLIMEPEAEELEFGEDDYASNYFDNGEDDDENAFGKDDGPTID